MITVGHCVTKVKMSPPITHDVTNHASVHWKVSGRACTGV